MVGLIGIYFFCGVLNFVIELYGDRLGWLVLI